MKREEMMRRWDVLRRSGFTIAEAAVRMGTTRGALDQAIQRAKNAGDPRAVRPNIDPRRPLTEEDPRHGTSHAYVHYGCRCEPCTVANRERHTAGDLSRRQRGLPEGDPRHGTDNAYNNWGCRCEVCAAFWREAMRLAQESRVRRGLPPGDARHGTHYGYQSWGCRCEACTEAASTSRREKRSAS